MSVMFDLIEQARLGEMHIACDAQSQLKAIIAIHNTTLGPALGGCRFLEYDNETEALNDAIRLAKGMSYKAALAGVAQGGGKSVILKPKGPFDRTQLFSAFGQFVEGLGGRYITAVDSGSCASDMEVISRYTQQVVGTQSSGGDPSPSTALGVLEGMRSCVKALFGQDSMQSIHVAIQGIGNVGYPLARMLHAEGARLTVTDIDTQRLDNAAHEFGATIVKPDDIASVPCDVFAPCGLGAVLNDLTLPILRCKAIAGSANNQLAEDHHGIELQQRGILYAPDYIINAGGLIHVCMAKSGADETAIHNKTLNIGKTISDVLARAEAEQRSTSEVANIMAEEILYHASQSFKPSKETAA